MKIFDPFEKRWREPDFEVTNAQAEAEGVIVDIASHNLRDPSGRLITYMSDGVQQWMQEDHLDMSDLAGWLKYARETSLVGEPCGFLYEIGFADHAAPKHLVQHDKEGRLWIEGAGDTATIYFPSER
jgi:hypothetical protein